MLTIEMVSGFLSKIQEYHAEQQKTNKDEAANLIIKINDDFCICQKAVENLVTLLRPKFALTNNQYKRYKKIINSIKELILEVDENANKGFDPIEYINCLLCVVDNRYEEAKQHNLSTITSWNNLYEGLYRVYHIYDAETLEDGRIKLGHNLSDRIEKLCNQ